MQGHEGRVTARALHGADLKEELNVSAGARRLDQTGLGCSGFPRFLLESLGRQTMVVSNMSVDATVVTLALPCLATSMQFTVQNTEGL